MMYIVYKLTSPNDKCYIGWTSIGMNLRLSKHKFDAKDGVISKINHALRKYPIEQWTKEVLYESSNLEESWSKEIHFIKYFDSINTGYNTSSGGRCGSYGCKRTEAFKLNMSKRVSGKGHPQFGTHQSEENRKNKSESALRRYNLWYKIIEPTGNVIIRQNLKQYCVENKLHRWGMKQVMNGNQEQHKGYKIELVDQPTLVNRVTQQIAA